MLDIRFNTTLRNITISRVRSNKPDIQHRKHAPLYSLHLQAKLVMDLRTALALAPKTALSYQQRKAHTMTVQTWLASACIPEWQQVKNSWVMAALDLSCDQHKTGCCPHSQTATPGRFLDGAQTTTPLLEYLCSNLDSFNSMPTTKRHIARQTSPSAPPKICCS